MGKIGLSSKQMDKNRVYYDGPKVSSRGRANGFTIDAEGNVFEKSGDTIPHKRTTEAGCLGKRKTQAAKNLLLGSQTRNVVMRHEKLLDQYLPVLEDPRKKPIGFSSTKIRDSVGDKPDMDIPPVTAYTDNRSAIKGSSFKSNCDPDEGFLMKANRFTEVNSKGPQPAFCDPPAFLNMREQIRNAQTQIHTAFGSSTPRTSPFAKKDPGPPSNRYTLPTTIVDRVPPPGWYNVAKSFKLTLDKRTFHRPYLATCPPAFDSSSARRSSLLASNRPTPAANRYNCSKWWRVKKINHHGATFTKKPFHSFFDVKPKVSPAPADHHIATILASSVAKRSFNARYPTQYDRPWTQIHPPRYKNGGKVEKTLFGNRRPTKSVGISVSKSRRS
ncbi:hypothetical protein BV898_19305 [Hypsibius exemplaris]|uniref:Uncharacterized protein n=1 Tax=Hypsibius exemplaris TaxID=2072580 RepID=A0A9X6NIP6_HYPEX|nr:hypothetical protein BV898_19305 [Hypsibius exemplaris]